MRAAVRAYEGRASSARELDGGKGGMISMGWDGGDISGGAGAGRGSAVLHWRAGEPGGQRAAGLVQPADGEGTAHDIAWAGDER